MSPELRAAPGIDVEDLPGDDAVVASLSWADDAEIDTFDEFVREFWAGRLNPDDFKRFRLQHGVYGQRQADVQMVRVKIPWGGLTALQLDRLADVAGRTPRGLGHVTTRQNVQFHFDERREASGEMIENVRATAWPASL